MDYRPSLEEAIYFFHPDERERLSNAIKRAIDYGEPYTMELRLVTAKGGLLWTSTICKPEVVNGKTIKLVGTIQDITERIDTEKQFRERENRYRIMVNSIQDMVFVHDINDIYIDVFSSSSSTLARPLEEFIGKHVSDVVSPELARKHVEMSAIVRLTGQPQNYDYSVEINGMHHWFTSILSLHEDGESIVTVDRDITQSRRAETFQKKTEEKYYRLIEGLPEGIIIGDIEENITLANKAMGKILGVDSNDLVGRNLMEFVEPLYVTQIKSQTRRRLSGTSSSYQIRMKRPDGESRDVMISAIPQIDEHDRIIGAIGVISDITEQKEMERELRSATYELRERMKEIRVVSEASDLMKDINTPLESVLHELIPIICKGFQDPGTTCGRITVDEYIVVSSNYDNPITTLSEEIWVYGKKVGDLEIGYLDLRPESDQGPFLTEEVSLVSQISVDLSQFIERQYAQQEKTQQSAKLNAVTNSTLDAIIMIDSEGLVQFWNPAAEDIFGYSEEDMIGKNLHAVITPAQFLDAHREGFAKFQNTGEGIAIGTTIELSGLRRDGSEFPIDLSLTSIKLEDDWGAVGIIRDITKRKQIELDLSQQRKELEIYTSLLRHDLNNDLAGIVGALEVVKMSLLEDPAEAVEFLDSSLALTMRMSNLLATMSRTQQYQDMPLERMVSEIAKISADTKIGLEIQVIAEDKLKGIKISGVRLLPMVFENLFRNAVQHAGDAPMITVEISTDEIYTRILVSDNGPGVPDGLGDQLFKKGTSTKEGGGLGLYLSRQIIESTGGSIELLPKKKDTGAQFEIRIPLNKEFV